MQFCKRDVAEILYTDVRSVVQWHSGVFVDPGVLHPCGDTIPHSQAGSRGSTSVV
jgi:hypothetical protein